MEDGRDGFLGDGGFLRGIGVVEDEGVVALGAGEVSPPISRAVGVASVVDKDVVS